MIKALLFDMDGTLVDISMQTFLPQYFGALSKKLAHLVAPEKLIVQLHASTKVMMNNSDPTRMLVDAFSADFFPKLGLTREQLEPLFHDFYATEYRALSTYARRVAGVREVLTRAFAATRKVALATGPFFPLTAITQRLEWGGVGDFPYALVTSYETMHTSKPHAAYYREIATQLDVAPEECVMIGDDPQMDMTPARGDENFLDYERWTFADRCARGLARYANGRRRVTRTRRIGGLASRLFKSRLTHLLT